MRSRMLVVAIALLLVVTGCGDDDTVPTAPDAMAPSAAPRAASTVLAFWQISGGLFHTCAVTTDFVPYCWGWNPVGQLGNGSVTGPDLCDPSQPCSVRPVAVLGGHRFRQVSAGDYHSCGVTADFHAWCWGNGARGDLGNGATEQATVPVAVAGGLRFRQLTAGLDFTCGVSYPDNRAYCWGLNNHGQIGDGTITDRLKPVRVLGGLRVLQLSAGKDQVCAVTTDDRAFCWGANNEGQLGDSTEVLKRRRPVAVVGGHRFRNIAASPHHTCAVTTSDRAFCWGEGSDGQLGNGKTDLSRWPRAVSGGLSFSRIGVGVVHTCAETTDNRAYCWGSNGLGALGTDGLPEQALTPVAVKGGLQFAQLGVGRWHTCGKTPSGVGYCWGENQYGQLGIGGSGPAITTPEPVVGVT